MSLQNISTFKTDLYNYYNNVINNSAYSDSNKDDMRTALNVQIARIDSALAIYNSGGEIYTATKDILLSLFSYISQKYGVTISDPLCPTITDYFISPKTMKDVYTYFTYTLPVIDDSFFSIEDNSGVGELTPKVAYESFITELSTTNSTEDKSNLTQLKTDISTIPQDRILYMVFAKPKTTPVSNFDPKLYLLDTLKFRDCLTAFDWTFPGLP